MFDVIQLIIRASSQSDRVSLSTVGRDWYRASMLELDPDFDSALAGLKTISLMRLGRPWTRLVSAEAVVCSGDLDLFNQYVRYRSISFENLPSACRGDVRIARGVISRLSTDVERVLWDVCRYGTAELIDYTFRITQHVSMYSRHSLMQRACLSGNLDNVMYVYNIWAHVGFNWRTCLYASCESGSLEVFTFMCSKLERRDFDEMLKCVAACGTVEMFKFVVSELGVSGRKLRDLKSRAVSDRNNAIIEYNTK